MVFRNDLTSAEVLGLVCTTEGAGDIVTEGPPAGEARVERSEHATLVSIDAIRAIAGVIDRDADGLPFADLRARQALNLAVDPDGPIAGAVRLEAVALKADGDVRVALGAGVESRAPRRGRVTARPGGVCREIGVCGGVPTFASVAENLRGPLILTATSNRRRVTLPSTTWATCARKDPLVSTSQRHILAVDDSDEVLAVFRLLLEEEGYRVTTQKYRFKDMDAVRDMKPDLIILDYMWAGDDAGWSMLQMLRMDRSTVRTPIVLCTGAKREVGDLGDRLTQQNVRVVLKPFDIDELLGVIAEALGTSGR